MIKSKLYTYIIDNIDNIEPEKRLYGVDKNYFENLDELLKYCMENHLSTQNITTLDYYRNFYDRKDVIRETNAERSMFYAVLDEDSYVWYSDKLNMHDKNWEYGFGE